VDVEAARPDDFYRARDVDTPVDGNERSVLRVRGVSPDATPADVRALFDAVALAPEFVASDVERGAGRHAGVVGRGPTAALAHNAYLALRLDTGRGSGEAFIVTASPAEAARGAAAWAAAHPPGAGGGGGHVEVAVSVKGEVYGLLSLEAEKGLGTDGDYAGCLRMRVAGGAEYRPDELRAALAPLALDAVLPGRRFDTRFSGELVAVFASPADAAEGAARLAAAAASGAPVMGGRAVDGVQRCTKGEGYALAGGAFLLHEDAEARCVVHVDGLPFKATPDDLAARFREHGAGPRDIFLHQRWDGKPAGDGFVVLPSEEAAAAAAAALARFDFPDRPGATTRQVCKQALYDILSRPPCEQGREAHPMSISRDNVDVMLRCKGVPFEVRGEDLEAFFAGFRVVNTHLHLDKVTGRTLGECGMGGGGEGRAGAAASGRRRGLQLLLVFVPPAHS
jgi:hypothetical protein